MADVPYPNMLAGGVTVTDIPGNGDLYAGEADIVSDAGTAGATNLEQFRVLARDETGKYVPWDPAAGAASATVTLTGAGTAADTLTINGHVITLVASGAAGQQVNIGASATLTAQAIKAYILAHPDETNVTASGAAAVLTLQALQAGVGGNSIPVVKTSTAITLSGATLAGGSAESEAKAVGVAAQPISAGAQGPIFTGGIFNHEKLIWPATVTTIFDRKRAFDGSNIGVRQLL